MILEETRYLPFSPEAIDEIENLSASGYTIEEVAIYFRLDVSFLFNQYNNPDSEFRIAYDSGMLKHKAKRDIELNRSASNGSITAIQILEKMLEKRRIEEYKYKLLNGLA